MSIKRPALKYAILFNVLQIHSWDSLKPCQTIGMVFEKGKYWPFSTFVSFLRFLQALLNHQIGGTKWQRWGCTTAYSVVESTTILRAARVRIPDLSRWTGTRSPFLENVTWFAGDVQLILRWQKLIKPSVRLEHHSPGRKPIVNEFKPYGQEDMSNEYPKKYRAIYRRAMTGRSRTAAIRAMCLQCGGYSEKEVTLCTSPNCPLFSYRLKGGGPIRPKKQEKNSQERAIGAKDGPRHWPVHAHRWWNA